VASRFKLGALTGYAEVAKEQAIATGELVQAIGAALAAVNLALWIGSQ
jgi:hypothetical protein